MFAARRATPMAWPRWVWIPITMVASRCPNPGTDEREHARAIFTHPSNQQPYQRSSETSASSSSSHSDEGPKHFLDEFADAALSRISLRRAAELQQLSASPATASSYTALPQNRSKAQPFTDAFFHAEFEDHIGHMEAQSDFPRRFRQWRATEQRKMCQAPESANNRITANTASPSRRIILEHNLSWQTIFSCLRCARWLSISSCVYFSPAHMAQQVPSGGADLGEGKPRNADPHLRSEGEGPTIVSGAIKTAQQVPSGGANLGEGNRTEQNKAKKNWGGMRADRTRTDEVSRAGTCGATASSTVFSLLRDEPPPCVH